MLACFTRVFTQDERSRELLAGIGVTTAVVSGDTRFDRVAEIVRANEELSPAAAFRTAADARILICGSTWPEDEGLLLNIIDDLPHAPRVIIAPHELLPRYLEQVEAGFPKPLITWSELEAAPAASFRPQVRTLLVDRMGLLARLYRYGDIAYVGGGFGDGIHSLLEAAAWGRPVIFGPRHGKFAEAKGLIDAGGGFEVRNEEGLRAVLGGLLGDPEALRKAGEAAKRYVASRTGATQVVAQAVIQAF
jgi:3-deoxy-D-manno-octulosonic-acid transferase